MDKSSKKTTKAPGKPFVKGDPRIQRGRGPKKGAPNAGRPPDWWKQEMREGRDRYLIAAKAAGILEDPEHPLYHTMGKFFHEAVDGRPTTPVELSVNTELAAALKLARDRVAGR